MRNMMIAIVIVAVMGWLHPYAGIMTYSLGVVFTYRGIRRAHPKRVLSMTAALLWPLAVTWGAIIEWRKG